jgi:hypothetical protein
MQSNQGGTLMDPDQNVSTKATRVPVFVIRALNANAAPRPQWVTIGYAYSYQRESLELSFSKPIQGDWAQIVLAPASSDDVEESQQA